MSLRARDEFPNGASPSSIRSRMSLGQALALAIVQGLTEFLPISSSAHLILWRVVSGQGPGAHDAAFDVAVHVGSLAAVLFYFRRLLEPLVAGLASSIRAPSTTTQAGRLAWAVLLGTLPVGLAGLFLKDIAEHGLRNVVVIAIACIGFGMLLGLAELRGGRARRLRAMRLTDVLVVGCAQAFALVPGASRSGVTMTAGLFAGLDRQAAARFSFLLSIPVIALAAAMKVQDLVQASEPVEWGAFAAGVVISAISAYASIEFLLRQLDRWGLLPFVVYRLVLGAVLLGI